MSEVVELRCEMFSQSWDKWDQGYRDQVMAKYPVFTSAMLLVGNGSLSISDNDEGRALSEALRDFFDSFWPEAGEEIEYPGTAGKCVQCGADISDYKFATADSLCAICDPELED